MPSTRPAQAVEVLLFKQLSTIVRAVRTTTATNYKQRVSPILKMLATRLPQSERQSLIERLRLELSLSRAEAIRLVDDASAFLYAAQAVRSVRVYVGNSLLKTGLQAGIKLGFDPLATNGKLLASTMLRIKEAAKLIKSIPVQHHVRVEKAVLSALRTGQSTSDLAKEIERIGSITRRRARIIARDQVGTALGEVTRIQQQSLGLKRFRWQTMSDERVRPAAGQKVRAGYNHRALHGRIFTWAEGAPKIYSYSGRPGVDILCRCQALPVIEDVKNLGEPARE